MPKQPERLSFEDYLQKLIAEKFNFDDLEKILAYLDCFCSEIEKDKLAQMFLFLRQFKIEDIYNPGLKTEVEDYIKFLLELKTKNKIKLISLEEIIKNLLEILGTIGSLTK